MPHGGAWYPTRSASSESATPTQNCSWTRYRVCNSSRPFDLAGWMPGSCSTRRNQIGSWINCRSQSTASALAVPAAHPLSKLKNLRLRDMTDARFIWFPRRESAAFYDRLMYECFRGGLKSPRIVQEASNEATILTLVAQGMGVGFVVETARWRCPDGVAILKVADLKLSLPLALVWRKDNLSPLLSRFVTDVGSLVKRKLTGAAR